MSGVSCYYDLENDFLKIYMKSKLTILEGSEESLKKMLQEKVLEPISKRKAEVEKDFELKQQEIYMSINSKLNQSNYTPHNHFKEINKWNDNQFKEFINKFNPKEIERFKEVLLENSKYFNDKAISGDRMNESFDNLGTSHRRMLNKIEESLTNNENLNNKPKRIKNKRSN